MTDQLLVQLPLSIKATEGHYQLANQDILWKMVATSRRTPNRLFLLTTMGGLYELV